MATGVFITTDMPPYWVGGHTAFRQDLVHYDCYDDLALILKSYFTVNFVCC